MHSPKKTASSDWLRSLLFLAQALILLSTCATRIPAQQGGLNRTSIRDTVRAIEQQEMDRQLLLASLPAKNDSDPARLIVLKQIREDFRDIQDLNNTMMANAWSRQELDYFYISDKVSQIRAKAVRLKTNLSLPEADVEKKQGDSVVTGVKEFRAALLLLDRSIMSFITNPLFQKTNVVEVGLATRASQDLDVVIKLGGNLQKTAATLNKKTKNNR